MSHGKLLRQFLGLLTLLFAAGCISVKISVTKLPDQTGGMYTISGTGFKDNESVSVEMQNAPLRQNPMPVGTTATVNGAFNLNTEDFRCTAVQNDTQRENLKNQQITFVATGVTSHYSASAVTTGRQILICP